MPSNSKAARIRNGSELTPKQVDDLRKALETESGMKYYTNLIDLANKETDSVLQDALIYQSLHFPETGKAWRKNANELTAALKKVRQGGSMEVTVAGKDGDHTINLGDYFGNATDNYINPDDVHKANQKRKGQRSSKGAAGMNIGYHDQKKGNDDPEVNIEREEFFGKLLAKMQKIDKKQGKKALMILLGSQGVDLNSYVRLKGQDKENWDDIYFAGESSKWKSLKDIGKLVGIPTMSLSIWRPKVVKAIKFVIMDSDPEFNPKDWKDPKNLQAYLGRMIFAKGKSRSNDSKGYTAGKKTPDE